MQPAPGTAPNIQDSVVSGNIHTGSVVHNHYHAAPQAQPQQVIVTQQPVYQSPVQVVNQPPYSNFQQLQSGRPLSYGGQKDILVAYILWFFLGFFGAHRFYLNQIALGFLYLLTFGLFGLGWFIDLFLIPDLVRQHNRR
ncbi:MAG TPA: TM2 domain-containing protein [Candidatus Poseidoniaceae archaeon]|nr:MAG TPA: TM2 domain-containing protein [Candidatus Poseidoniales archaeon]HII11448.1 TM2 domain-containing protein [Candidatus Poseidoniaceae archaeon]|tara:strand:+ start:285 stop:701 length:417 start_codon:yes stop_codon:yes gene_type:complete